MTDDDLTPFEDDMMKSLPKERMPSAPLEDRVVGALQDRGVLRGRSRRSVELTPGRIAGVLAASLALLVGGFALGTSFDRAGVVTPDHAANPSSTPVTEASPALVLQQAGTAYIQALEHFAVAGVGAHGDEMAQGREVALTTLYTAADQVARIVPREYLTGQLVVALDVADKARRAVGEDDGRMRSIEF